MTHSLLLPTVTCVLAILPFALASAEPYTPSARLVAVEQELLSSRPKSRESLLELLRIESVSADPERKHHVKAAAEWLVQRLRTAGLQNVQLMPTDADRSQTAAANELFHPVVYADWLHAKDPNAPTLLIYGHYDVQPEDPVHLWTTPPFDPNVRGDRLYARGASDDKGHMYLPIVAVEAWLNAVPEGLPLNVKFLLEGEEEVGSGHLAPFLRNHAARFAADYVVSADGGQVSPEQPGLCLGLRGTTALQVDVFGADKDSHSGTFGGGIANPLHALADLLASLRTREDGSILVPGFYDGVPPVSDEDRDDFAEYAKVKPAHELLTSVGANVSFGEKGYTFYERTWARPSLEVVGMWGGFQGAGIKTVLPSSAHAKLSARLVGDQDPGKVSESITRHLKTVGAEIPGVRVQVTTLKFNGKPFLTPKGGVANRAAAKVLTKVYNGASPIYFRMGGSIPVTAILRDVLGLETVMFAFGHNDENVHAPDEFARLSSFDRGESAYASLFEVLASEHVAENGAGADGAQNDGETGKEDL